MYKDALKQTELTDEAALILTRDFMTVAAVCKELSLQPIQVHTRMNRLGFRPVLVGGKEFYLSGHLAALQKIS